MAVIVTDEDFNLAIAQWQSTQPLPVAPSYWFRDSTARKLFLVTPGTPDTYQDVTPNTATLEAALDTANASIAAENVQTTTETVALKQAKKYLRNQLQSANPNITNIYNNVKGYVESDAVLLQMVTNQQTLMTTALGWVLNLITPTATDRMRYLLIVQAVLPLLD